MPLFQRPRVSPILNFFSLLTAALFLFVLAYANSTASQAYTLLPPECGQSVDACINTKQLSYVTVLGPIEDQDKEIFEAINKSLPDGASFPVVYLNSPGGELRTAIQIGRILRKNDAEVRSGSPQFPQFRPECASACTLIAAGATHRYLSEIGLHSGATRVPVSCQLTKKVPLEEATEVMVSSYLRDMNMPDAVESISRVTPDERLKTFYLEKNEPVSNQEITKLGYFTGEQKDILRILPAAFGYYNAVASKSEYLKAAADFGVIDAKWKFIEYVSHSDHADYGDRRDALEMVKRFAMEGDAFAHYLLGNYLSTGYGAVKDTRQATEHYKIAAENGVMPAQALLGEAYLLGRGVPQDIPSAISWSSMAAVQGEARAYETLCYAFGKSAQNDVSRQIGAGWCHLASFSTDQPGKLSKLKSAEASLTAGMDHSTLNAVEDWAINWKPSYKKGDYPCEPGAERFKSPD